MGALDITVETTEQPVDSHVTARTSRSKALLSIRAATKSFFDVFTELAPAPKGNHWQLDSFFDLTYRMEFSDLMTMGAPSRQSFDTSLHLLSQGGGLYKGQLQPPIKVGGITLTEATLKLNAPNPGTSNGLAATRVRECFRTEKGANPNDPYLLVTKNFGRDPVTVRQAVLFCEGALKTKEPIAAGTTSPLPIPNVAWDCFSILSKASPNRLFRIFTSNFGETPAIVRRAILMCEDARKIRIDAAGNEVPGSAVGEPTGRVYECYQLQAKNPAATFWLTNRNFGGAPVRVTNARLMCEAAIKVPMNQFPTANDGAGTQAG